MSLIIQHIYDHLAAISEITDIVGTDPCKIFPGQALKEVNDSVGIKQKVTAPYIVFRTSGGDPERHMGGDTGTTIGNFAFQFFGRTWSQAESLFNAFRQKVDTDNHTTWGTVRVQRVFVDDPVDITEDPVTGAPLEFPSFESFVELVYERTAASP
jgi:hypothetical protein